MTKRTASQIGKSNVNRGKSNERRIAALLSEWSGYTFRRRRVEGRDNLTVSRDLTGDVIAGDYNFMFIIEGKCGKGFSLDALLNSYSTSIFSKWWVQNNYDTFIAKQVTDQEFFPMLFFRPSPNLDWIAFSANALLKLISKTKNVDDLDCLKYNYYNRTIQYNITNNKKHPTMQNVALDDVIFCRWKDFAKTISTENLFRPKNQKPEK